MEKFKAIGLLLNADGTSITFDYTMGFARVGNKGIKLFLHHNVWRSTPN